MSESHHECHTQTDIVNQWGTVWDWCKNMTLFIRSPILGPTNIWWHPQYVSLLHVSQHRVMPIPVATYTHIWPFRRYVTIWATMAISHPHWVRQMGVVYGLGVLMKSSTTWWLSICHDLSICDKKCIPASRYICTCKFDSRRHVDIYIYIVVVKLHFALQYYVFVIASRCVGLVRVGCVANPEWNAGAGRPGPRLYNHRCA